MLYRNSNIIYFFKCSTIHSARCLLIPFTCIKSSTDAFLILSTDPKCSRSAPFLSLPIPGMASSSECVSLAVRFRLCDATANLCASSRICMRSLRAPDVYGRIITPPASFFDVMICSCRFARPMSGISRVSSSVTSAQRLPAQVPRQ